jgi:hypothetical protein
MVFMRGCKVKSHVHPHKGALSFIHPREVGASKWILQSPQREVEAKWLLLM